MILSETIVCVLFCPCIPADMWPNVAIIAPTDIFLAVGPFRTLRENNHRSFHAKTTLNMSKNCIAGGIGHGLVLVQTHNTYGTGEARRLAAFPLRAVPTRCASSGKRVFQPARPS